MQDKMQGLSAIFKINNANDNIEPLINDEYDTSNRRQRGPNNNKMSTLQDDEGDSMNPIRNYKTQA